MALDPASRARVNLATASILLLDETSLGMSILVQIVTGFGAKHLHRCNTVEQAREVSLLNEVDLAIVDSLMTTGEGYDFVSWLRREAPEPNRFAPVIVTTSHTPTRDVTRARDCGGHILVKKPIAPIVLMERIMWVSKGGRAFLHSEGYAGPDRRFRSDPECGFARRREDRAPDGAAATVEVDHKEAS